MTDGRILGQYMLEREARTEERLILLERLREAVEALELPRKKCLACGLLRWGIMDCGYLPPDFDERILAVRAALDALS